MRMIRPKKNKCLVPNYVLKNIGRDPALGRDFFFIIFIL